MGQLCPAGDGLGRDLRAPDLRAVDGGKPHEGPSGIVADLGGIAAAAEVGAAAQMRAVRLLIAVEEGGGLLLGQGLVGREMLAVDAVGDALAQRPVDGLAVPAAVLHVGERPAPGPGVGGLIAGQQSVGAEERHNKHGPGHVAVRLELVEGHAVHQTERIGVDDVFLIFHTVDVFKGAGSRIGGADRACSQAKNQRAQKQKRSPTFALFHCFDLLKLFSAYNYIRSTRKKQEKVYTCIPFYCMLYYQKYSCRKTRGR